MNTAEQNYRLLQEIEANRMFLLMACQQNPKLLERADERIKQMFEGTVLQDHSIPHTFSRAEAEISPLLLKDQGGKGSKQRGISLIELIIFMVIISIAVAGVLLVMNKVTGQSSDALIRKQALAIAESVLEEVELQDFISALGVTACPPNPTPNPVTQANRATGYHIVCDYNGFATAGIFSASTGAAIANLGIYTLGVAITPSALGAIPAASSVLITVTVIDPQGTPLQLSAYRTAY